ncbi:caspase family protein [Streptomyces sp. NPDC085481]|uniref:VMAP-C domain-containing protein n=1 Tax=Streptomyces sp. NPDC085481 TaxID=3365727 RepID=UPI0037D95AE3
MREERAAHPTDLSDAHAVVVAIEEYADGGDWQLDGPAADAARMMGWLVRRGMPEENIVLLASPLARNALNFAEFTRVDQRTADRATIRQVFREELRELPGDWLWVYWAGHGLIMGENKWGLLYPESRANDLDAVDAENLLSLLNTAHLPARRVRRATVIIDACRSALPPRMHVHARRPEPIAEESLTDVERKVFLMRAAQLGSVAKNPGGAGLFTSNLLGVLEEHGRADAPIDLDAAWLALRARFEELRDAGDTPQLPTLYARNWDEKEDHLDLVPRETGERRRGRRLLARAVRTVLDGGTVSAARIAQGLEEQLGTEPPAGEDAEGLADWALTSAHGPATLLHLLAEAAPAAMGAYEWQELAVTVSLDHWMLCREYDELVRLLVDEPAPVHKVFADTARHVVGLVLDSDRPVHVMDELEARRVGPQQLPPLLRTVEHTAAALRPAPLAERLRDWSLRCARRLGVEQALVERRVEAEKSVAPQGDGGRGPEADDCVQIRLSRVAGERWTYRMWTRGPDGTADLLAAGDTSQDLDAVERHVDALLVRYARPGRTRVEFFLDAKDLELAVHRWHIGAGQPVRRAIGIEFDVVVRCADQRFESHDHLWRDRWTRVGAADTGDLHWPSAAADPAKVYAELLNRDDAPGIVLTTPAGARGAVLTVCVFGGAPVVFWHGGREEDGGREQLRRLLAAGALADLPAALRRLRAHDAAQDDHPGSHLALLWDDPDRRLPPSLPLSAP